MSKIVRVKSSHPESQGPFVEMLEQDFDSSKYELYVEPGAPEPATPPAPAPAPTPAPVPDAPPPAPAPAPKAQPNKSQGG